MGRIKKFDQHANHINEESPDYLNNIKIVQVNKEIHDMAAEMVGDNKEPNLFFVSASNDYGFLDEDGNLVFYSDAYKKAPVKIEKEIRVETFGPFETFKDAMKKADELDLNETVGPRHVTIEDRKTGQIYEKFLKAEKKIIWGDELNDETKTYGYRK